MNRREKDLQECLLSTVIGGVLSYITCLILPCVGDTMDTIGLYVIGWFMYIWIVWSVIDCIQIPERREKKNDQN